MLEDDLRTLRAGRASSELVATLAVPCYGSSQPLQGIASISADERNQLLVQVWDKGLMKNAEDAIRNSQLGFSVNNDGTYLHLSLPPLSQERRMEMVKVVHQKGEATRVEIRKIRQNEIQKAENDKKSGAIREDDYKRFVKDADDLIGNLNDQIKKVIDAKEKEVMTV